MLIFNPGFPSQKRLCACIFEKNIVYVQRGTGVSLVALWPSTAEVGCSHKEGSDILWLVECVGKFIPRRSCQHRGYPGGTTSALQYRPLHTSHTQTSCFTHLSGVLDERKYSPWFGFGLLLADVIHVYIHQVTVWSKRKKHAIIPLKCFTWEIYHKLFTIA